jgi:hypothetical protein
MANIYRIYPVLWTEAPCNQAQTVYAIDRSPNTFPTACSTRVKEDPAYYWESPNFLRLLPQSSMNCCQPTSYNAVTWQNMPSWLSYVRTLGYTVQGEWKPMREFFIQGP